MTADYVGRFAPSVTGPLHFGSLVAAVASYLDARAHRGHWYLRLDDLDIPRQVPGAERAILEALDAHGLTWDGSVVRQSERTEAYRDAFVRLANVGELFLCSCSRRQLKGLARYPGTCRARTLLSGADADSWVGNAAVRIRAAAKDYGFLDRVFGSQGERLDAHTGDFIVRRRDGLYAYQLAVVVDDASAGVTDIVRGVDLLDNTPRQLFLMDRLGIEPPRYAHFPVVTDRRGSKLSKQTFAGAIGAENASMNLYVALALLGQEPPPGLCTEQTDTVLDWGVQHWRMGKVPAAQAFPGFVSI